VGPPKSRNTAIEEVENPSGFEKAI